MRFRFISLFASGAFLGCAAGTEPLDHLRVTAAVAPTAVDSGFGVTITVAVANPTARPITATSPSSCFLL